MSNIFAGCLARKMYSAKRETAAAFLIQKYVCRWLLRCAYVKLCSAAILIQSNIRAFSTRQRFLHRKKHKAVTLIQVNLTGDIHVSSGGISVYELTSFIFNFTFRFSYSFVCAISTIIFLCFFFFFVIIIIIFLLFLRLYSCSLLLTCSKF